MEEPPETQEGKRELALEDWEHDAEGMATLNFQRFTRSIFQIADKVGPLSVDPPPPPPCLSLSHDIPSPPLSLIQWTDKICVETYRLFLQKLVDALTVVDDSGKRGLRAAKGVVLLEHDEIEGVQERDQGKEEKGPATSQSRPVEEKKRDKVRRVSSSPKRSNKSSKTRRRKAQGEEE